jgi:DUF1365 family protein
MSEGASAFYAGTVMHRRLRPRQHRLQYRVFSLLLDLDEIDGLSQRLRLFSRNRFNVFSFHDSDYGAGTPEPLRAQVEAHMREAGLDPDGGPIRLLTMPRILGYAFNPLSVYFCYRSDSALVAILCEVNNTFSQRHNYLIGVTDSDNETGLVRQECAKGFYVSPFLDMNMIYAFRVVPPGRRVSISITGRDAEGPMIVAILAAERAPLSDAALTRAFIIFPLLTLKVIAGIHWEALLLWLKGLRLRSRPPAPDRSVTIARSPQTMPPAPEPRTRLGHP